MGHHFLFQGIFLTQGSNFRLLQLLHWQWILYHSTIWEAYKSLYLPSSPVLAILLVMGPHFEWQGSRVSLIAQLVKNSPAMQDLIPGLGRFPGEGKGYPLQYSGLENSMDCVVHGVTKLGMTVQLSLSFSKEINLEYSLERLMLKLKLQHFVKNRLIGKDPGAGKD